MPLQRVYAKYGLPVIMYANYNNKRIIFSFSQGGQPEYPLCFSSGPVIYKMSGLIYLHCARTLASKAMMVAYQFRFWQLLW